jgi:hypothetical protein
MSPLVLYLKISPPLPEQAFNMPLKVLASELLLDF